LFVLPSTLLETAGMRQAVVSLLGEGARASLLGAGVGRRPLDYLLGDIARHGVAEILLLVDRSGDDAEAAYQGARIGGALIRVVRIDEAAGTLPALRAAADRLDPVFLTAGAGSFFDLNYLALAQALGADDLGALAVRDLAAAAPAYADVCVLRREALDRRWSDGDSLEDELIPALAAAGRLALAAFAGRFIDIGAPGDVARARTELAAATHRPAVFFDRDDTLNHDVGYTHRPQDLAWTPGAIAAVRAVNDAGWLAIVATNQAGVARGLYSEADVDRFHAHMQAELATHGAHIDAFYICPFHEAASIEAYRRADHPRRKPNPGMLLAAFDDFDIDREASVMVGDRESDLAAARAAGVRGLLYKDGDLLALLAPALAARRA
jgi:D,D-heptose 1,7-bisphosphate phosphatase